VAQSSDTLKTVVGSCIALCLWDRENRTGGMVHIMLPSHDRSRDGLKGKYADTAVHALLDAMEKKGSRRQDLVASVVGGASIFGRFSRVPVPSVGTLNYESVRGQLRECAIPVRLEETGGSSGRRVVLDCSTGRVSVTTLGNGHWTGGKGGMLP